MSWVAAGVAGASLVTGMMGAKQKEKQDKAGMMANAEAMRYSPWTHMNTQMQAPTAEDPGLAGLKAGLGGAMAGSQFAQQFKTAPQAPVGEQGPMLKFK